MQDAEQDNIESRSASDLRERVKRAKAAQEEPEKSNETGMDPTRFAVEIVASVGLGVFLGLQIDKWLDTKPIFFLIFFFLGVAAAGYNIYKLATKNSD